MDRAPRDLLSNLKRLATKQGADELAGRLRQAARAMREPPENGRLPGEGGDGRSSIYEPTWSAQDEAEAKRLIFNTESEESFAEGGQRDANRLRPFFDESSTVLDLGCGIGRVARYVAPDCSLLWAVDVTKKMLDLAAVRLADHHNVVFLHSTDVEMSEVPSESIDLAYSFLVLQHLEREDAYLLLEELRRVVKPSGTVVITYPNLLSDEYLQSFIDYARSRASRDAGRARPYTPEEVTRLMQAAGFGVELEAGIEIVAVARPI